MEISFCPRCGTRVELAFRHGRMRPSCPACRFIHFANPRVAVVIFAAEADRVLLVKRKVVPEKGKWALAAGFMDLGEAPEEAAIREMKEETGLDIRVRGMMELGFDSTSRAVVILYRADVVGGHLAAADDVEDARWFSRDAIPELAFDTTRRSVRAWLAETL